VKFKKPERLKRFARLADLIDADVLSWR